MNTNDALFRSLPSPWNRILPIVSAVLVWGLFFWIIYFLRSFFLLLFLTFVFSYIQARGVSRLERLIKKRIPRVLIVAMMLWSTLTAAAFFLGPQVKEQTQVFISQFTTYLATVDKEIYSLGEKYPQLGEFIPELLAPAAEETPPEGSEKKSSRPSPTGIIVQQLLGLGEMSGAGSSGGTGTAGGLSGGSGIPNINYILDRASEIGSKIAAAASSFFLALLFSFLIILDLPNLTNKVRELENTKLRFLYRSVAENICEFSLVLGRALEAQLIIAIVNSMLTAIGITMLGMGQHVAFLSVIVFLCSFFPVLGVFISSVPICLIALQSEGLHIMLLAIVLITVIHIIEGYILNPRIYGSYMRINSVIVLIILTVAGKLFNVWGLLLGVPVCTYIFGYAIRFKNGVDTGSDEAYLRQPAAPLPQIDESSAEETQYSEISASSEKAANE